MNVRFMIIYITVGSVFGRKPLVSAASAAFFFFFFLFAILLV